MNELWNDRIFDDNDKLAGVVQWDEDSEKGLPQIYVNSRTYSGGELGEEVMTKEGFTIEIKLSGLSCEEK